MKKPAKKIKSKKCKRCKDKIKSGDYCIRCKNRIWINNL